MNKKILLIILATIISNIISVYATYSYLASDIKYVKSDGTISNVETAINDLYTIENNKELKRLLIGTVGYPETNHTFDCTNVDGWQDLKTEDFSVVITGLYANGTVGSYYDLSSAMSYDASTGKLFVNNWTGISARTDLRYSANVYLYYID